MKVLVFAHDSSLYGASQSLFTLLCKLEFEFLVLLPYPGKLEALLQEANINYKIVHFPIAAKQKPENYKIGRTVKDYIKYKIRLKKLIPELQKIATDFHPHLIYTNTSVVTVGYMISKSLGLPHVWHIREFGWLDYRLLYYPSKARIKGWIRQSKSVIFISRSLYGNWFEKGLTNALVIPNGIVESETGVVREFPATLFRIGILGALVPGKGQNTAIEAFAKVADKHSRCILYIYGDAINKTYFVELQALCRHFHVEDKVVFTSFQTDKVSIYKNLDLLLNCSNMEGFGRTIVEAMQYGIPVIANASGGVPEIIDDGVNGLLYHSTSDSLFDKIMMLLHDKDLYKAISKNGIEKAVREYSIQQYVESIGKVFERSVK